MERKAGELRGSGEQGGKIHFGVDESFNVRIYADSTEGLDAVCILCANNNKCDHKIALKPCFVPCG